METPPHQVLYLQLHIPNLRVHGQDRVSPFQSHLQRILPLAGPVIDVQLEDEPIPKDAVPRRPQPIHLVDLPKQIIRESNAVQIESELVDLRNRGRHDAQDDLMNAARLRPPRQIVGNGEDERLCFAFAQNPWQLRARLVHPRERSAPRTLRRHEVYLVPVVHYVRMRQLPERLIEIGLVRPPLVPMPQVEPIDALPPIVRRRSALHLDRA